MNLNELLTASRDALSQTSNDAILTSLALEAERMADMTGWAIGPIDPQGKIADAFAVLKQQARQGFEETQSPEVAQLHDALAELINAIVRHDDDLRPDGVGATQDDD
jgi:hypothetical protein